MFGDQKDTQQNLKDSGADNIGVTIKDTSTPISYTKTNKLITALYMVTDIMDKDEPLKNKLRTLGTGIISDIHHQHIQILSKISEIMSFLDIASAVHIISEMNCNILRKEFLELKRSVQESSNETETTSRPVDLSELFGESTRTGGGLPSTKNYQTLSVRSAHSERTHIGHSRSTSIGVQKGSTLMRALSRVEMSDRGSRNFDALKKQRREEIILSIKGNGGNATIKDIKDKAQGSLANCGEKTLQRELVSMVKEDVLNKTGEKRWSRYFMKN